MAVRHWPLLVVILAAPPKAHAEVTFADARAANESLVQVYQACQDPEADFVRFRTTVESIGWTEETTLEALLFVELQSSYVITRAVLSRLSYPDSFAKAETLVPRDEIEAGIENKTEFISLQYEQFQEEVSRDTAAGRPFTKFMGVFRHHDGDSWVAVWASRTPEGSALHCEMIGRQVDNPVLTEAFFGRPVEELQHGGWHRASRWFVQERESIEEAAMLTPHAKQPYPLLATDFDIYLRDYVWTKP